jgi:Ser/Thr protein kinase RdoA (MazF antagonist)
MLQAGLSGSQGNASQAPSGNLDEEQIAGLAAEYGLGKVQDVVASPLGWSRVAKHQRNFLVEAGRSKVIFRFDDRRGDIEVKREVDLFLYLRKHGFPCPQPIPDRKSRHFRAVGGARLTAYKNIDGRRPAVADLSPGQIEGVGRILGELHLICKGYKKGIENRFTFERVADLYAEIRPELPSYFRRFTRALDEEVEYLGDFLEAKLPKGVIYGDLLSENVLLKGDKLVGIVGFDAVCRGKFIFDLATAVNAVCFVDGSYDLKRFETVIGGYESNRTLSLAEWDSFPNELRFSAFRFTVTKLREILAFRNGPSYLSLISEERLPPPSNDPRVVALHGFQEFFDRLSILRRERDGGMESLLLAMATGYDYRRYQKVKAVGRRARQA